MINNFPMFHQNIFIICVLITIFIYFGKNENRIFFKCKLYLILKVRAQYQKLFKLGQQFL